MSRYVRVTHVQGNPWKSMMLYNKFNLVTSMIVCYQPTLTKFKLKKIFKVKKKILSSDLKNI